MNLSAKSVIITGANTGLGYECAKNIASESKSWHVILACRDEKKGQEAVTRMISESGNPHIHLIQLDLSSFSSVKEFVKSYTQNQFPPLKGLVCNAGLSGEDMVTFTKDGIEITFQVNCVSHFLLIHLLLSHLSSPARIIMVSSELHRNDGPMKSFLPNYTNAHDLAHPNQEKASSKGSGSIRYSTSKLCMLLYTHKFNDWFAQKGLNHIQINAFNPGLMPDTGLGGLNKKLLRKWFLKYILPLFVKEAMSTPQRSGKLLAELVTAEKMGGITGKYFDREKQIAPSKESFDKNKMDDLWNTSIELTNIEHEI
jgi:NAD(P)-dependent dehydrogenase (short-subunit alcohol dehydrogenase family)